MSGTLATGSGKSVRLGKELGRGGEGAVFALAEQPGVVAKIYHQPPQREKGDKLVAMAAGCTEKLSRIAAWPTETLHERNGAPVRGFLMRSVARDKDIHILYGPKTRLRDYPEATYRFLVHVAANVARAFAVVHEHGHVIGDVNQGGICVSAQGTVSLVDCDSFQVASSSRLFSCDVGIPIYQPPEFQSVRTFRGLRRDANHDCFGLAVLIFQTLFLARHPYAGAFLADGEMPLERSIREFRFAYARDANRRQMKQPPGSLGLGSVSTELASLFERAFLEDGARGRRPTAREWIDALDAFAGALRDCAQNPGHAHLKTMSTCALCEIEGRAGTLLFLPPRQASLSTPPVNLDDVWRDALAVIEAARLPPTTDLRSTVPHAAFPFQPDRFQHLVGERRSSLVDAQLRAEALQTAIADHPAHVAAQKRRKAVAFTAASIGAVVCLGLAATSAPFALTGIVPCLALAIAFRRAPPTREELAESLAAEEGRARAAQQALSTAEGQARATQDALQRMTAAKERAELIVRELERDRASANLAQLHQRVAQAQRLYQELKAFDQRRAEQLRQFEMRRHYCQLSRFLDRFEVKDCGLKGFGRGLFATLVSNGVETADDVAVQRLSQIQGFGPKRVNALIAWRQSLEAKFRFNASDPIDGQERARVERDLNIEYGKGVAGLRRSADQLIATARPVAARNQSMLGELRACKDAHAKAHASALDLARTS